jgi:N-acetylglucosamine-6-phosphate deacetylase
LAGWALADDRLAVGLIADGVHVHPLVMQLAARALGPRLVVVTDAVAPLGVPPDPARSSGQDDRTGDPRAAAAVWLADGTLAGSLCPLDQAVANLREMGGLPLEEALAAVTAAPARLLGREGERGVVAPGAVADLVLLDTGHPGRIDVVATVIGGRLAHRDPAGKVAGGRRPGR